ncbi:hypothetical protein [Streptomyces sp. NPDC051776]|uniref:hypothetical protein n=1 Tax=Streptomyces sp. NPDC051776 TaxID=3155414 RepID=UPI003433E550
MTDEEVPRDTGGGDGHRKRRPQQRKQVLLRLDPAVHDAIARWAEAELRSANAQIEYLLRRALAETGRLPRTAGPMPRRGRPPRATGRTVEAGGERRAAEAGGERRTAEAGGEREAGPRPD